MSVDAWTVADPIGCAVCGLEACEDHVGGPRAARRDHGDHSAVIAKRAVDIIAEPPPVEIVSGIAASNCLTVLVSESGAGKTFVLLNLAASVAADVSWHGRAVQRGSVVYIGFEGDALNLRLRALRDAQGFPLDDVHILRLSDPLSPRTTRDGEEPSHGERVVTASLEALVEEIAADARPPILVVEFDTVRASMTGSEDSSEHVAAYLRAVRRILSRVPGAACVLAHHAGWQDGETQRKRERGSSAWRGNCDITLYLEAGEYDRDHGTAPLTLRTLKTRDAERPTELHLVRRRVELLGMDREGEPLTSCVIEADRRSREDRDSERAIAIDAERSETDLGVLRAIAARPDLATSQDQLRVLLGTRKAVVGAAVSRLVQRGLVMPNRRNQPYTLTDIGRAELVATSMNTNGSQQFPTVPGNGSRTVPRFPLLGNREPVPLAETTTEEGGSH